MKKRILTGSLLLAGALALLALPACNNTTSLPSSPFASQPPPTFTVIGTYTFTPTITSSPTNTPTLAPTNTPGNTGTATFTSTGSATYTFTGTPTATFTFSSTPTFTNSTTPTPSFTATFTNSNTITDTPTNTPTFATPIATVNANTTMTESPTLDNHSSPTFTPSPLFTYTPSGLTPSPTPTPYPFTWSLYALLGQSGTSGANGYFESAAGIAIGNGFIAVSDSSYGNVQVFSNTGLYLYNVTPSKGLSPGLQGLAMDPNGELYICDPGNSEVDGYYLGTSGATYDYTWSGQGTLGTPYGVRIDGQGNLVVADYSNGAAYNLAWADDTVLATSMNDPSISLPNDVALDAQGNIYIADNVALNSMGQIVAYDYTYNFLQSIQGSSWGIPLSNPIYSVTFDSQNNLFASDPSNGRVVYLNTQGGYLGEVDQVVTPNFLALDNSDDLFVVDLNYNRVLEFVKN